MRKSQQRQRIEDLEFALYRARVALEQTRQYVGEELLPAKPGWAWFDVTARIDELIGPPAPGIIRFAPKPESAAGDTEVTSVKREEPKRARNGEMDPHW